MDDYFKEFASEKEKEEYLKENYPLDPIPAMTDMKCCLICGKVFQVKEFKVWSGDCICCGERFELIVCPNCPECDGDCTEWVGFETLN